MLGRMGLVTPSDSFLDFGLSGFVGFRVGHRGVGLVV